MEYASSQTCLGLSGNKWKTLQAEYVRTRYRFRPGRSRIAACGDFVWLAEVNFVVNPLFTSIDKVEYAAYIHLRRDGHNSSQCRKQQLCDCGIRSHSVTRMTRATHHQRSFEKSQRKKSMGRTQRPIGDSDELSLLSLKPNSVPTRSLE